MRQHEEKPLVGCFKTRDERYHITFALSATLTTSKLFAIFAGLFIIFFLYSAPLGTDAQLSLQRRVHELESAMTKKMVWLMKHQRRVREYQPGFGMKFAEGSTIWTPQRYPDGRSR